MENKQEELEKFKARLRTYFADYVASEGCDCCRNQEEHEIAYNRITKLLDVSENEDGYRDIWEYRHK